MAGAAVAMMLASQALAASVPASPPLAASNLASPALAASSTASSPLGPRATKAGGNTVLGPVAIGAPEATPFGARPQLTGDWGGVRSWLADQGVGVELYYTFEAMGTVAGGVEPGLDGLGNLDLIADLDLQDLIGWVGGRLFVYVIGTHGGQPSGRVGDVQGVSNIEAPFGWRLFEAYLEQRLWGDQLSLRAGFMDINTEFDLIPVAAFFIHSSFGMGGDIGTSGVNGPSTFPVTSLGLRVEARPFDASFLRLVVADGVPQDPEDAGLTRLDLSGRDGVLVVGEVGLLNLPSDDVTERVRRRFGEAPTPEDRRYGLFGKLALGMWTYSTRFDDPVLGRGRGTLGAYALVQQTLFHERDDPRDGLSVFARAGGARERGHVVDIYLGGGAVYQGLLPLERQDRIGLGVAAAHPVTNGPWEVAVELTYRCPVLGWLSLQPDVQVVLNPAATDGADDAVVVTLRTLIEI